MSCPRGLNHWIFYLARLAPCTRLTFSNHSVRYVPCCTWIMLTVQREVWYITLAIFYCNILNIFSSYRTKKGLHSPRVLSLYSSLICEFRNVPSVTTHSSLRIEVISSSHITYLFISICTFTPCLQEVLRQCFHPALLPVFQATYCNNGFHNILRNRTWILIHLQLSKHIFSINIMQSQ